MSQCFRKDINKYLLPLAFAWMNALNSPIFKSLRLLSQDEHEDTAGSDFQYRPRTCYGTHRSSRAISDDQCPQFSHSGHLSSEVLKQAMPKLLELQNNDCHRDIGSRLVASTTKRRQGFKNLGAVMVDLRCCDLSRTSLSIQECNQTAARAGGRSLWNGGSVCRVVDHERTIWLHGVSWCRQFGGRNRKPLDCSV